MNKLPNSPFPQFSSPPLSPDSLIPNSQLPRRHALMTEMTDPRDKFITTESLDRAGEAGERLVWEAVQAAFRDRDCIGYWRYPIFSQAGQYRKEPDILIADREWGLIVIEVKAIAIDQITAISGHRWEYQNFYLAAGNPYQQAENQVFSLLEYSDREPSLKGKVSGRALVALPAIAQSEWQERGFHQLPTSPPILFQEDLRVVESLCDFHSGTLRERLQHVPTVAAGQPLTEEQWQLLLCVLAGTPVYRQPRHRVLAQGQSRGKVLVRLRDRLSQLDLQQERIAKQIPPGPQRLRGIAGSGKSVLLCQKAAHSHLKYPHWTIALVFFSRSLYRPILDQLDRWLRYFSKEEVKYDPKNRHLRVLHAWGAKKQPGLYSTLCWEAGVKRLTANDTQSKKPNEALAEACTHLLQAAAIPQLFDAILIDEGQDLVVDNCTFEGKQPFYWLAYQALRPADPARPDSKRLIWACDEFQSLESLRSPTASELFGDRLGHIVTGQYPGGIRKSENLTRCYRTPQPILAAAQALGMGLLRPGGMLTGVTRPEDWRAIGYEVLSLPKDRGQPMTVKRSPSPNPIPELWPGPCIEFQACKDRTSELADLAENLRHNLRYDGLRPSREILVIIIGSPFEAIQLETHASQFLLQQGIDIFLPGTAECNHLGKKHPYPNKFWCDGAVTVSRIHRAKGQEADMVYVIGLDRIAQDESNPYLRNQLLVALTRARSWVKTSGIGNYPLYAEIDRVLRSGDTFTFTPHRSPQRQLCLTDVGELLQQYARGKRNFCYLNLSQAQLAGINLQNAGLIGANLQGANLQNACLDGAKLVAADLSHANLSGASLKRAKLIGANLQAANLSQADLSFANLSDADLQDADLSGTCFEGTHLQDGSFTTTLKQ